MNLYKCPKESVFLSICIAVQCVLPINMYNEKIYIFLWFWMAFVLFVTICSFITWVIRYSTWDFNLKYSIQKRLQKLWFMHQMVYLVWLAELGNIVLIPSFHLCYLLMIRITFRNQAEIGDRSQVITYFGDQKLKVGVFKSHLTASVILAQVLNIATYGSHTPHRGDSLWLYAKLANH